MPDSHDWKQRIKAWEKEGIKTVILGLPDRLSDTIRYEDIKERMKAKIKNEN
jgi:hypothetical protein